MYAGVMILEKSQALDFQKSSKKGCSSVSLPRSSMSLMARPQLPCKCGQNQLSGIPP